jgi:hypothetical protein
VVIDRYGRQAEAGYSAFGRRRRGVEVFASRKFFEVFGEGGAKCSPLAAKMTPEIRRGRIRIDRVVRGGLKPN